MYGSTGKILRIDLSKESYTTEDTSPYFKEYLGGRALNHILLFRDIDVTRVSPFDPKNEIIFGTGPLCGTTWPSAGRLQATFIAPLPYSGWGDSNMGGAIGPELKFAGWDTVVIKGKANKPTYIYIEDERIEFKSANDLWGKGIDKCNIVLNKRHLGCQMLLIGPAGENIVRFASIRTQRSNSLGRCGGGAVMGSKNLKGLVVKGSKGVKIFDPENFLDLSLKCQMDLVDPNFGSLHSQSNAIMSKYGTPGFTRLIGRTGMTPLKNWNQCGIWSDDVELTEMFGDKWWERQDACYSCPIHCLGAYQTEDTKSPSSSGGPGYDSVVALGRNCLEPRAKIVLKLNAMCNDLGIDQVELGNSFSTMMEWYEKGIIDEKFTDGVPMKWGNGEGMIELATKIASRKGCGNKLAEGPYRLGKELGKEALKCVYHQKGMCSTGFENRSAIGSMLSSALSPRGSHHLSGLPTTELLNSPSVAARVTGFKEAGDIRSYHPEAKARLVQFYENLFELPDSMGICKYPFGHFGFWHDRPKDIEKMWNYLSKALYYATGEKFTKNELMEIGERAYQIERAVIVLRGIRRKDDMPNWKCLNEDCPGEHPVGPVPLPPIDHKKYEKILDRYYKLRGWTNEGIPTRKRLRELNLKDVADVLEKRVLKSAKRKK
ncbi:MAG: aldehyde ferredoxin oxidoreductase family protein [Deltaproteobacteria bacterium]|nr:aldehyde ferredoxin oxidoreductase family protein [Deltaproteobacteria bacterium]